MDTSSYIVSGENLFKKTPSGTENVGYLEKISFNKKGGFSVMVSNNGKKSFFNTKNLTWS